jgi:uncharacterized glyoxalase superfamily protein PhnB
MPSIVAPVSRFLASADVNRSLAFYRDVLGFELPAVNVIGEPVSQPWGLRDFEVRDLEGNRIRFGQPFE